LAPPEAAAKPPRAALTIATDREPVTLEQVLRAFGPHANGRAPESDEELLGRLEGCGRAARALPSPSHRALLRELWTEHLSREVIPAIPNAWRVVREAFDAVADPGGARAWHWLTAAELPSLPAPVELVRGHIVAGSLALVYGPRGFGKTFWGLDLGYHVATGIAYHGHAVTAGPVRYILAEGRGGLPQRVAALQEEHGGTDPDLRFLTQAVRLLDDGDVERLVRELVGDPPPALVVFDTLARCLAPGDENSTQDMGRAVAALDRIREATGAAVLVMHHTGHDKSRERGSSALAAAADTVIAIARDADVLTMSCEKQRDATEFQPLRFRLHEVGSSVVPRLVMGEGPSGLSAAEQQVLQALDEACLDGEFTAISRWQSLVDVPDRTFWRARKRLVDLALIETSGTGRNVRYRPRLTDNERESLP